ncbi:uncharacterized protein LOC142544380 [Primulina tabacum]|uniref:uncharacterized protein LOC142544380 n=1 Tax=Primulina tabacum TaxID=48773 RepID=UPI003F595232
MNLNNSQGAPILMYPPEFFQYPFMPPPPYGISPPIAAGFGSDESRRTSTEGTGTEKESMTPTSVPRSHLPPHSSPVGLENIILDKDTHSGNEDHAPQPKKVSWSLGEEKVLAMSWVVISTDPKIGNSQKMEQMWARIAVEYNKNRPARTIERRWQPLKSHFYYMQKMTSLFNGIYNKVHSQWGSGCNDADILVKAHEEWMTEPKNKNKPFKYEHVWRILAECQKFAPQSIDHRGMKKKKTSASGEYTSSSNPEMGVDEDEERSCSRPIGQKAAKRKGKNKLAAYEELKDSIDKNMEEFTAYTQQKLEEIRSHNRTREYQILMKDTTAMTQEQLRIHVHMCDEIKKKWGIY